MGTRDDRVDERDRMADARERNADERERVADAGEERSDARELVLDRWEQRLVERAAELAVEDPDNDLPGLDAARRRRATEWADRRAAAEARRNARIERTIAEEIRQRPPTKSAAQADSDPIDGLRFSHLAVHLQAATRMSEVLDRLLDVAPDLVPGCESASISLSLDGPLAAAASTASWAEEIERAQHDRQAGPSPTAMVDAIAHTADLTADERWPELHPLRPVTPARSALSFGLSIGGEPTGVLTFYSRAVDAFGPVTLRAGDILAAQASVALDRTLERMTHEARYEAWQHALASRDLIGQAKGILMEQDGITADEAFIRLRERSQRLNLKVRDLAQHLVTHRSLPG